MSQNKSIQTINPQIRHNKNFIFKGKSYPIDFTLVKKNSNYFYERRDEFKNVKDIQLTEELIDISEDSIPVFISSCHNESFEINDTNVFSLHQLSVKYEVPYLISLTDDFIKKYDKTLIFRSIQYKYQLKTKNSSETTNVSSLEKDEEYIASNLFDYINNDQLLDLPISVLYRIINNSKLDINKLNETNKNQLIDFLFKCLDKHGKKASILFLNLDVENQRIELFSKLNNEYSNVFDFNMINHEFLMKTTTDLLSKLSQLERNYSESISQVNQVLEQIKDEKQKQKESFDLFKNYAQEQLKNEIEKLNEYFQSLKKQIEDERKKEQDFTDSFKKSAQEQLNNESEKLNEYFQNLKKQIEDEKKKQKYLNYSFKQSIQQQFNNENDKINKYIQSLKKQIEDGNKNIRDEAANNINQLKLLVNENEGKMSYFITKDIIIHMNFLIKFDFIYFDLVSFNFFCIKFQHYYFFCTIKIIYLM